MNELERKTNELTAQLNHLVFITQQSWVKEKTNLTAISVEGLDNNTTLLNDLFSDQVNGLVFTFEETDCDVCLKQQFSQLRSIDKSNFAIVGIFEKTRYLTTYVRVHELGDLSDRIFFSRKHLVLGIDEYQLSYYFSYDKDLLVRDLHIPMKGFPEVTGAFLAQRQ